MSAEKEKSLIKRYHRDIFTISLHRATLPLQAPTLALPPLPLSTYGAPSSATLYVWRSILCRSLHLALPTLVYYTRQFCLFLRRPSSPSTPLRSPPVLWVYLRRVAPKALRYIRQIAQETSDEVVYGLGRQPAVLRTFSQKLSRGFNDAINGFNDDGWASLNCDGAEDVIVAFTSAKNLMTSLNALPVLGGVLCAKVSMLLQNVPPAVLIRFLREHRSEWVDFNIDAYAATSLKASTYTYSGTRPTRFIGSQIIMPLDHTIEHEETLEVVRLEGHPLSHYDAFSTRDIHLLQMCSRVEENTVGACSKVVFAPIDEMFPDDAPLLPSGF